MAVATVWTRNCQKEKIVEVPKDYTWSPNSGELEYVSAGLEL